MFAQQYTSIDETVIRKGLGTMRSTGGLDSRGREASEAAWEAGRGAVYGASVVRDIFSGYNMSY